MLEKKADKSAASISWHVNSPIDYYYNLHLTKDIFNNSNSFLSKTGVSRDVKIRLVFIDDGISKDLIDKARNYFLEFEQSVKVVLLNCSEKNKNIDLLLSVCREMEKFNVERKGNPVIAMGGGVLLDVVGFASSVYRRGVPYVKVPTTLLSLVDTSVAIKTSINIFGKRNRFGAFYPAIAVGISPMFLKSLPKKQFSYGLGEIIKIAIVKSEKLFILLEKNSDSLLNYEFYSSEIGMEIIELACHHMLEELEPNLKETNLERIVDFGHTFSPIPEMKSLEDENVSELAHGEAVFLDVLFSCAMAEKLFRLNKELLARILNLGISCKLPIEHPYFKDPDILYESCLDATRHRAGFLNLPLPQGLEKVSFLKEINWDNIKENIDYLEKRIREIRNG